MKDASASIRGTQRRAHRSERVLENFRETDVRRRASRKYMKHTNAPPVPPPPVPPPPPPPPSSGDARGGFRLRIPKGCHIFRDDVPTHRGVP